MHRFIFLILILSFLSCENATESKIREIATFKDVVIEGHHSFEIPPISTTGLQRVIAEVTYSNTIEYAIEPVYENTWHLELYHYNTIWLFDPDIRDMRGASTFDTTDTTRHVVAVMDRHDGSIGRLFLGRFLNLRMHVDSAINQTLYLRSATVIAEY